MIRIRNSTNRGSIMFKIKIIILIAILAYLGFIGWNRFFGEGGSSSAPKRTLSTETDEREDDGGFLNLTEDKKTKVSPLAKHHLDLKGISTSIFSSLTGQQQDETYRLKTLWNQAQSDFKQGWIEESDAQVVASLIRELNEMNTDRLLYDKRYTKIESYTKADFVSSRALEEKKRFAKQELGRQWKDWVYVNRAKLDPLFANLSE